MQETANRNRIGARLLKARQDKELTTDEVRDTLIRKLPGYPVPTRTTINNLERAKVMRPNPQHIEMLCAVYEIPVREIDTDTADALATFYDFTETAWPPSDVSTWIHHHYTPAA